MDQASETPAASTGEWSLARDEKAATQSGVTVHRSFGVPEHESKHHHVCMHWPLDGATKIHAASQSLAVLARSWSRIDADTKACNHIIPRCIDVSEVATRAETDLLRLRAVAMSAEIQKIKLCTRALVEDFQKVGEWLARAAGSTWDAAKTVRRTRALASTLDEDHRVVAKDWLAADMNFLIAWLLRQAIKLLDRLELTPKAIETDLIGARCYGDILGSAAGMLDHAAILANESELFVVEMDQRWRTFRDHIARVVALSKDAAGDGTEPSP